MKTGVTQVWNCSLSDRTYSTSPYQNAGAGVGATAPGVASPDASSLGTGTSNARLRQLDAELEISECLISEADSVTSMAELTTTGEGMATLYFYPDGSSSSARIVVRDKEHGHPFAIVLNGLAGTARSVRLVEGKP